MTIHNTAVLTILLIPFTSSLEMKVEDFDSNFRVQTVTMEEEAKEFITSNLLLGLLIIFETTFSPLT